MESRRNRDFETAVFAVGTLKRGFPLHERGLAGAPFLGIYRTVQPFPLLIAGPWFAPMLLDRPGLGLRVMGELYLVDESMMAGLDELESVGKPGNFRRLIQVERAGSGDIRPAFCFMKAPDLARPVHSDFLEDYQDRRFVPPEDRL
jgi:gamma-glutamylaminecyclotransferase